MNKSLNNEEDYLYTVEMEKDEMVELRNNIKNNGYKVDHSINKSVSNRIIKQ